MKSIYTFLGSVSGKYIKKSITNKFLSSYAASNISYEKSILKKQFIFSENRKLTTKAQIDQESSEGFAKTTIKSDKDPLLEINNELHYTNTFTPYKYVNELLTFFTPGIINVFKKNLVGIYLSGSLSYGNFEEYRSDIDLVIILSNSILSKELVLIREFHKKLEDKYPVWANRLECSYVHTDMLISLDPPSCPRPYYNSGIFYDEAPYGNEWIVNNYLLYQYGISLIGPNFSKLIPEIKVEEVQKACIKDLLQEWQTKTIDLEWQNDPNYQSYIVLNLCRILYTITQCPTGSKVISAQWAKEKLGEEWRSLIEEAEKWQYGKEMTRGKEVVQFIDFVVKYASQTPLYSMMQEELNQDGLKIEGVSDTSYSQNTCNNLLSTPPSDEYYCELNGEESVISKET